MNNGCQRHADGAGFFELRRRLAIRTRQKAFHPDATQFTLHIKPGMFGFWPEP